MPENDNNSGNNHTNNDDKKNANITTETVTIKTTG